MISRQLDDFKATDLNHFGPTLHKTNVGLKFGQHMLPNADVRITAEGRLFGLNSGDWMTLVGGFALVALVIFLL